MGLTVERMAIAELSLDPANLRTHPEANILAIVASLRRWGQQKPIVIDSRRVVRCGNGTLEAARRLGWTEIDCIVSDLAGAELTAFAIADNRTAELAEWSEELAGVLAAIAAELPDLDTEGLGFDTLDLDAGGQAGADDPYSKKLVAPVYHPTGECPTLASLSDTTKTAALVAEIAAAELPEDVAKDEDLLAFRQNADRRGRRLEWVFEDAEKWAITYGWGGILIDVPRPDVEPLNEAERLAMGLRPYAVIYTPENITNWSLDESGKLKWVRLREAAPDKTGPFDARAEGGTLYRTWTRDAWYLDEVTQPGGNGTSKAARRIAEGEHELGKVPFVPMYSYRNDQTVLPGKSTIRDISQINFRIYNWCSLLDEEVYNKCLNILLVANDGSANPSSEVVIGSRNVLQFDGLTPPSYLSPPTEPMEAIVRLIDKHKDYIYRLAKLGGVYKMQDTGVTGSGVAMKQEFLETNQALRHHADEMEQTAREVWDVACRWVGRENGFDGGTINYPDEFGVEDFYELLQAMMLIRNEIPSETAQREAAKEFISGYFPHLDQKKRQTMFSEIDAAKIAKPVRVDINPDADSNLMKNMRGQMAPEDAERNRQRGEVANEARKATAK